MTLNAYPKTLVIIPAFNEEKAIFRLVHEIREQAPWADIAVINDRSTDHTAAEAKRAGARVINLPINLGIGGAVQTGYLFALKKGYDIAIQLDGDGQHPPSSLADLMSPLAANKLDLCIGSRFLKEDPSFKSTFLRRLGIRFFRGLLQGMTGLALTDPTSGFRACNAKLIRCFATYYPVDFPEPEAIKIARRYGYRVGEIPVAMRERQGGQSSIRAFKTFYYMWKVTLAIFIDTLKAKPREKHHAS